MTLNSEGLEKAREAVGTIPGAALWNAVETAITAYLSTLPPVDGLEVVGWEHKLTGIIRQRGDKPSLGVADGDYEELCRVSQASSVIAGLKDEVERLTKERDAAIRHSKSCAHRIRNQRTQLKWLQPPDRLKRHAHLPGYRIGLHVNKLHELWRRDADRAQAAEARISSLEESNEALMRERTSLIDTKRGQIERLTSQLAETARTALSLDGEAQEMSARISSLEEENKRLREALTPSASTKAAYMGEFSIAIERHVNEDEEVDDEAEGAPDPYMHVTVPWTTIKEIMAAIRAYAQTEDHNG